MIKKIFLYTLIFSVFSTSLYAIAKVPDDLFAELQDYRRQSEIVTNNADIWFDLAMSCAYTGFVEEGFEALKKIENIEKNYAKKKVVKLKDKLDKNPEDWKIRFKFAFATYSLTIDRKKNGISREEAAVIRNKAYDQFEIITQKLGKHFVSVWAYGYMGYIRGEQERYDEAIKIVKKGLKIEPDATALHYALGYGYLKTGNYFGLIGETITVTRLQAEENAFYNGAHQRFRDESEGE